MLSGVNRLITLVVARADRSTPEVLTETFVDVGSLSQLLESRDHQVIFGRRGTGKTHAFSYHAARVRDRGDCAILIDMRSLGSTTGIYADTTLPVHERGTRLLVDALHVIREALEEYIVQASLDDAALTAALGALGELEAESVRVTVEGELERETLRSEEANAGKGTNIGVTLGSGIGITGGHKRERAETASTQERRRATGALRHRVRFGRVAAPIRKISALITPAHVWVLFDEWTVVPRDLQPLLADLIRRVLLPIDGLTVKIGAIEPRSLFSVSRSPGDYTGIELGADMTANVNLDELLSFEREIETTAAFYGRLICEHVRARAALADEPLPDSDADLLTEIFSHPGALSELARAAGGVPRDAIGILHKAAIRAGAEMISARDITLSAHVWHEQDKEANLESERARDAWRRLVEIVVQERHARAFALEEGEAQQSERIRSLYDQRLLHLLKRNIVSRDDPGLRYYIFAIDYGLYAGSTRVTKGLFEFIEEDGERAWAELVRDEYKSLAPAVVFLSDLDQRPRRLTRPDAEPKAREQRKATRKKTEPPLVRDLVYRVRTDEGQEMEVMVADNPDDERATSPNSPVGLALKRSQVGESVQVRAPGGAWIARVIEIRLLE